MIKMDFILHFNEFVKQSNRFLACNYYKKRTIFPRYVLSRGKSFLAHTGLTVNLFRVLGFLIDRVNLNHKDIHYCIYIYLYIFVCIGLHVLFPVLLFYIFVYILKPTIYNYTYKYVNTNLTFHYFLKEL